MPLPFKASASAIAGASLVAAVAATPSTAVAQDAPETQCLSVVNVIGGECDLKKSFCDQIAFLDSKDTAPVGQRSAEVDAAKEQRELMRVVIGCAP